MANFDMSYDRLLKHEGGYSDDPHDRGGETYKGISRKYHPSWGGWDIIDKSKLESNFPFSLDNNEKLDIFTRQFYKNEFWDKFIGDQIQNQAISDEMFDTGVNMGMSKSIKFVQIGLNCLNRNGGDYPDVDEDGKMGPITLGILNNYINNYRIDYLYKVLNILQGYKYIDIMKRDKSQERFARGWLNRVNLTKD